MNKFSISIIYTGHRILAYCDKNIAILIMLGIKRTILKWSVILTNRSFRNEYYIIDFEIWML